jgi:hypothetical protein
MDMYKILALNMAKILVNIKIVLIILTVVIKRD